MASPTETSVTYEELRDLENEFEDVETEISKSVFLRIPCIFRHPILVYLFLGIVHH